MANNTNYNIYIGDYEDGYMVTHNKNSKVKELLLFENHKLNIPDDSIIVFQTISPWYIEDELKLKDETKLLFWNLHPYNLLAYFRNYREDIPFIFRIALPYIQHLMRKFATNLLTHDGLVFMDGENRMGAEEMLGKKIENPYYLPVAGETPNRFSFTYGNSFAWIGRLADFKISILVHTMEKLAEYAYVNTYEIKFHIIGDGPERWRVEKSASECENEYFKTFFVGEIEYLQIENYLISSVNVLFAMGTSALEGSRIGIPTVLLDFSYQSFEIDYRYRYLFETEEYTLGREIRHIGYKNDGLQLGELINELRDSKRYQVVSDKCFEYYYANHDVKSVSHKLLDAIERSNLRFEEIKSLRNNLVMNAFKISRKLVRNVILKN